MPKYLDGAGLAHFWNNIQDQTGRMRKDIDALKDAALAYEVGTISASGEDEAATNRIRTVGYTTVDGFDRVTIDSPYRLRVFVYDKNYALVARMAWLASGIGFSATDITSAYPSAAFFRFIFAYDASASGRAMAIDEVETSNLSVILDKSVPTLRAELARIGSTTNEAYGDVAIGANKAAYMGERIVIPVEIGATGGLQGGCIFGDELFQFNADGTFSVFSMTTKQVVGSGTLGSASTILPHCNSAVFGSEYYDVADDYPLLYINAYNNTNLPKGTCYVHRLQKTSDSTWTTTLVQTITIGFTDTSDWTDGSSDTRPYGNFAVDAADGMLWAYTLLDTTNVTRFFSFALPELGDGDVTLTTADLIDQFDTPRFAYIQDNRIAYGKMYVCSGQTNAGYIHVIDLSRGQEVTRINLSKVGMTWEPEVIDIYDGRVVCGKSTLYRFEL